MRRLWLLPLFALFVVPAAAQDKGGKADDPKALFQFEVKPNQGNIVVTGTAKQLPDGTKMRASIEVGDWPVQWKKAYVMRGAFRFIFPRRYYRANSYKVHMLYELRGQIRELTKALSKIPARASHRVPFRLGTLKEEAAARAEETRKSHTALSKLEAHLAKGETIFADNKKLRKQKKYSSNTARAQYENWLRQLDEICGDLKKYSDANKALYRPRQVDQTLNLFRVSSRFGKALYRAELQAIGVKQIPRKWQARGMLSTPPMVKQHVEREMPPLLATLTKQVESDNAAAAKAAEGGE